MEHYWDTRDTLEHKYSSVHDEGSTLSLTAETFVSSSGDTDSVQQHSQVQAPIERPPVEALRKAAPPPPACAGDAPLRSCYTCPHLCCYGNAGVHRHYGCADVWNTDVDMTAGEACRGVAQGNAVFKNHDPLYLLASSSLDLHLAAYFKSNLLVSFCFENVNYTTHSA